LILSGGLVAGEHIRSTRIAQQLGISRIPVREALIALEREGWVTIRSGRGAFVNPLDEQYVRDHYQLLGELLGFAVERAVARRDPDFTVRILDLARAMAAVEDPEDFSRLAFEFQSAVVAEARSPRVRMLLRAMSNLVPGNFYVTIPAAMPIEKRGRADIARAVRQGDPEQAAAAFSAMMARVGEEVVSVLRARRVLAESA
jgi:DNA-binding GntR family transcriptional regulator